MRPFGAFGSCETISVPFPFGATRSVPERWPRHAHDRCRRAAEGLLDALARAALAVERAREVDRPDSQADRRDGGDSGDACRRRAASAGAAAGRSAARRGPRRRCAHGDPAAARAQAPRTRATPPRSSAPRARAWQRLARREVLLVARATRRGGQSRPARTRPCSRAGSVAPYDLLGLAQQLAQAR